MEDFHKAELISFNTERPGQLFCIRPGNHGHGEHHHIGGNFYLLPRQGIGPPHRYCIPIPEHPGYSPPDIDNAVLFSPPLVKLLIHLSVSSYIHVKDIDGAVVNGVLVEHTHLAAVHAANARTVGKVMLRIPRPYTLDKHHLFGHPSVGGPFNHPVSGTRWTENAFKLEGIQDIGIPFILPDEARSKELVARRNDNRPHGEGFIALGQGMINGVGFTGTDTGHALTASGTVKAAASLCHGFFSSEHFLLRPDHGKRLRVFPFFPRGGTPSPLI